VILAAALAAPLADEAPAVIPFKDVRPGMKGYGKTVFSGSRVETFEVEVLGVMTNVAPKKNVILARLSGGPLAQTGVVEGMSGSPVYLEGKLAGAVAYAWGFAKEPICGITPIEEMLEILARRPEGEEGRRAGASRAPPGPLRLTSEPDRAAAFLRKRLAAVAGAPLPDGLRPARIPLILGGAARSGAAGRGLRLWEETFAELGFHPTLAGSSGGDTVAAEPLQPGAAVGVQLVRGDVEVAGIGTVTHVRGDEVLAFGHPFFSLGPTGLPMTRVQVHGLFPSLASSFKMAATAGPVGRFTQDRFGGLAGVIGDGPPVVPVTINLVSEKDRATEFRYEIVEDPLLTPVLLHLTLLEILATAEKEIGDVTLSIHKGSQIRVEGGLDVRLENLYSGDQSEWFASAVVAYMTYLLMNNPDRPSRVLGVDLDLGYADALRLARIERIWCDRYTVAPGETLPLHVAVSPYRGERFTVDIPLEIPEEAPEGRAFLQVGDAVTLSRMEFEAGGGAAFQPSTVEQLVFLLNRIRVNNRIYATVIRPDTGAFAAGERLPNLPPSIASVLLSPQREESGAVRVHVRGLLEAERDTDYLLRGYQKAVLEIRR
jgi:hypothetical protein